MNSPKLSILAYGPPRSGKSLCMTTLGKGLLVLDCDGGMASCRTFQDQFTEARRSVDVEDYTDFPSPETYPRIRARVSAIRRAERAGKGTHRAYMLDSLSFLAEACKTHHTARSAQGKVTQRVYLDAMEDLFLLLAEFYTIPALTILTGHTKEIEHLDKDGNVINQKIKLGVYGKQLPDKILGLYDDVWYTDTERKAGELKYVIRTKSPLFVCGSRYQVPDGTLQSLGLPAILKTYMGFDWNAGDTQCPST